MKRSDGPPHWGPLSGLQGKNGKCNTRWGGETRSKDHWKDFWRRQGISECSDRDLQLNWNWCWITFAHINHRTEIVSNLPSYGDRTANKNRLGEPISWSYTYRLTRKKGSIITQRGHVKLHLYKNFPSYKPHILRSGDHEQTHRQIYMRLITIKDTLRWKWTCLEHGTFYGEGAEFSDVFAGRIDGGGRNLP